MVIVGIDPGIGGAIAMVSEAGVLKVIDMPIMPKSATKNQINVMALRSMLQDCADHKTDVTVYLENVHAMPGQGVSSMFSFGESLGAIRATIQCLELPLVWVSPQKWKRYFGLTSDKKLTTKMACDLYPQSHADLVTPRGRCMDGRAEAILIARYGLEQIK